MGAAADASRPGAPGNVFEKISLNGTVLGVFFLFFFWRCDFLHAAAIASSVCGYRSIILLVIWSEVWVIYSLTPGIRFLREAVHCVPIVYRNGHFDARRARRIRFMKTVWWQRFSVWHIQNAKLHLISEIITLKVWHVTWKQTKWSNLLPPWWSS